MHLNGSRAARYRLLAGDAGGDAPTAGGSHTTVGDQFVGLSLVEAVARATSEGYVVRLAREDGSEFVLTTDLDFRRISIVVENS